MTVAFLALGSNIEPEKNILEAVRRLSRHVKVLKNSTVYLTEPLYHKNQPKYYNCVLEIETDIEPHRLKLEVLRPIEISLGRKRGHNKYSSRTIDIDLILYGGVQIADDVLEIPDPEIEERSFVAIPLAEIAPKLLLPPANRPLKEVLEQFKRDQLVQLKDFTQKLKKLIEQLSVQKS